MITDVKFDFHQPVLNGAEEEKLLLKLSLLEEKEHFIKHKLIDDLKIEKMLKEMDQIILSAASCVLIIIGMPLFYPYKPYSLGTSQLNHCC